MMPRGRYMAPELNTREAYHGWPVDLWALGCFAYEVLHNTPPFRGESLETLNLRIKKVDHHPFRKSLSSDAKRAIGALLVAAPHSRCLAAAAAPMWQTVASMARQARQAEVVETREAKYIPP